MMKMKNLEAMKMKVVACSHGEKLLQASPQANALM